MTVIEFCEANVDQCARERLRALDGDGVRVVAKPCCQRCGACYDGPFLVVDGTPAYGPHGALLDDIDGVDADATGRPVEGTGEGATATDRTAPAGTER
jgi:uncharacterized protein YuzB (UPF0349 family)